MAAVTLIRAQPRDPATGAVVPVKLAGGGSALPYPDGYRAGVVRAPRFSARLGFEAGGWSGGTVPTVSDLSFVPADPALVDAYARLIWDRAPIEVDSGDEAAALVRLLTGAVAGRRAGTDGLALGIADLSASLAKPLVTGFFAGTGGLEGSADAAGRAKRISLGRVFDVECRLFDKAYAIYEFGDPGRPMQGCSAIRDKGREGALEILAWQGSAMATLTALRAATVPDGGGVVAPSIALARWWTTPVGPLTVDVLGDDVGGYVESAPAIAARISAIVNGPAITNVAEAQGWRGAPAGLHVEDGGETASAAIDRLLLGVSLLWRLTPAGVIELRPWTWDGPAEALGAIWLGRDTSYPPMARRRLGYRLNNRVHTDAEIAASLLDELVDEDGTPISVLIANAQATADAKTTTFIQATAPSAAESEVNDLWINTAEANRLYKRLDGSGRLALGGDRLLLDGNAILMPWTVADDQRIAQAILDAATAKGTADGKVESFSMFRPTDPVPNGRGGGDLLYRLYLDPVRVDQWTGASWEPIATYGATAAQAGAIISALEAAANAQATADGKIVTYFQDDPPLGASEGDLWIDTNDGNRLYRHSGIAFVAARDAGIGTAITAAAGAQATADGKVTTFVGEVEPVAEGVGDLWYRPSTGILSRWSGSAWIGTATAGAPAGTNVGGTPAADVGSTIKTGGGVADNKVTTPALVANSVNIPAVVSSIYAFVGSASEQVILSYTISLDYAATVIVSFSAWGYITSTGPRTNWAIFSRRSTTPTSYIAAIGYDPLRTLDSYSASLTAIGSIDLPAGAHTIELVWNATSGFTVQSPAMVVQAIKR